MESTIFENLAIPILLAEVITTVFALITLRIFLGKTWPRLIALRWPSLIHLGLVLIGLPGMLILPNLVHRFAKDIGFPVFEDPEQMARFLGNWSLWFGVLVIGLGPGLSEELWCRGFLGRGLVGNYGPLWGVLLTSLLFGLLHVDLAHAVATAVIGVWLHFVYLMSRSLLIPMMLHALNNSTAVFLAGIQLRLEGNEAHPESAVLPNSFCLQIYEPLAFVEQLSSDHPLILLAGSLALLSGVCWALYKSRARLVATVDAATPWRPDFPGVEYPPPGSATMVFRPWPGWLASALVLAGTLSFAGSIYWAAMQ
jgi:membrane protease YdiL (CAAX protease family)